MLHLKFTYYAQYYAQEQELLSNYYGFYMLRNSMHVADNFHKEECINERYQNNSLCSIIR